MASPAELLATDLAVVADRREKDFPREQDWQPQAGLRLRAIPVDPATTSEGVRWLLSTRHQPEDAATAEIREGNLSRKGSSPIPVVLKVKREDAALNTRAGAIEHRFNREQMILADLHKKVPVGVKRLLPQTWDPHGAERLDQYSLRLNQNLVFCLAAQHALALPPSASEHEEIRNQVLLNTIGNAPGCAGCKVHESGAARRVDNSPIPPACRPWIVANRAGGLAGLAMEATHALILSDCGRSMKSQLDLSECDRAKATDLDISVGPRRTAAELEGDLDNLLHWAYDLAHTLQQVHRAGWLHLDVNFDNLCTVKKRCRLIDFGHSEKTTPDGAQERGDRIPLRRIDFAAPEMLMRALSLTVLAHGPRQLRLLGHVGWPQSLWPRPGDILSLPSTRDEVVIESCDLSSFQGELLITTNAPIPVPGSGPFGVTLHRTAGPGADVYSFGLWLLCMVLRIPKPVILRDELAIFERALYRNINEDNVFTLTDDTWWVSFRRVFERTSELMDFFSREWRKPIESIPRGQARNRLLWLFQQFVTIGVRCVVRASDWTYVSSDFRKSNTGTPFTAIAKDLTNLIAPWNSKGPFHVVFMPLSISQFLANLRRRLKRLGIEELLRIAQGPIDSVQEEFSALADIIPALREVIEDRNQLKIWLDSVNQVFNDWQHRYNRLLANVPWGSVLIRPFSTIHRFFRGSSALEPDQQVIKGAEYLAILAANFSISESLSPNFMTFATSVSVWNQIFDAPGRAYGESRILHRIAENWEHHRAVFDSMLKTYDPRKSKKGEQAEAAMRRLHSTLIDFLFKINERLETLQRTRKQIAQRTKAELTVLLPEHRTTAENAFTNALEQLESIHGALTRRKNVMDSIIKYANRSLNLSHADSTLGLSQLQSDLENMHAILRGRSNSPPE